MIRSNDITRFSSLLRQVLTAFNRGYHRISTVSIHGAKNYYVGYNLLDKSPSVPSIPLNPHTDLPSATLPPLLRPKGHVKIAYFPTIRNRDIDTKEYKAKTRTGISNGLGAV